jgi:outer membrane protein OmpA-like peptidoglycan-associated protein
LVQVPATSAPPAKPPPLPQSVPTVASIPPVAPPAEATAPPPPPPISESATTKAEPASQGLRLLFGAGSADLSPDSAASLKQLAGSAPQSDATSFNVAAYAPGNRDDPSTARRLSLARAMAVRSALVTSGVPSARIYVRALGEAFGAGPPDRVDVSVLGANADGTLQAPPK